VKTDLGRKRNVPRTNWHVRSLRSFGFRSLRARRDSLLSGAHSEFRPCNGHRNGSKTHMELPGNGVHMPFVTCEIGWAPDFGAPIEAAQGFPNRASVEPCYSYAPAPSHNRRRPCHRGTREQSDCPAIRRQWSEDRHHAKLAGGDARYYVSEDDTGAIEAYVIPRGLNEDSRSIELKRIVVAVPSAAWADVSLTRLSAQHSVRSAHTGCFSTSRKTTPAPGTCMRASDSNTRESCAKRHTGMDAGST
jgi:hypothetical protein